MHRTSCRQSLRLEALEDRRLLATLTVLNTDDSGPGSLRQAIFDANQTVEPDTIQFNTDAGLGNVFDGGAENLIRLTSGELVITNALTIDGGTSGVTITGDAIGDDALVSGTPITDVAASLDGVDLLDDNSRIFNIDDPASTNESFDVTLIGLTLTGGRTTDSNSTNDTTHSGGAIRSLSSGFLSLASSTVSGNSTSGDDARGGGIYTNSGDVTLNSSTVSGNSTGGDDALGGGIFAFFGEVTLNSSTISGNSTSGDTAHGGGFLLVFGDVVLTNSTVSGNSTSGDDARGGGIFALSGNVTLTSSTVSGNSTSGYQTLGGGIFTGWTTLTPVGNLFRSDAGTVNLINSTISGNSVTGANSNGGGLYAAGSVINIANSTIVDNSATGTGGGIGLDPDFAEVILPDDTIVDRTVTLHNSIIAGNSDGGTAPDFIAPNDPAANLDIQHSLIGDALGTGLSATGGTPDANGNLIGAHNSPLDPILGPLGDNGGPTPTHRLLPGSPAINAGDNALIPVGFDSDQRGLPFVRDDGSGVDIGSYERQTLTDPAWFVVTTAGDELDFTNSDISLREAIESANGSIGADTITFDPAVFDDESSDLIRLTMGELQISEQLTIDGLSSSTAGVTITGDANGDDDLEAGTQITDVGASLAGRFIGDDRLDDNSRIFNIGDPAFTNESFDVTLIGLTLTGGRTMGDAILSTTVNVGGAIRSLTNGTLSLTSSTVSGNSTGGDEALGGGIAASGGVALNSSTVSGNSTRGVGAYGGGIFALSGDVTLTDSTVSENYTLGDEASGGGIFALSGDVTLAGSTISENFTLGDEASGGGIFALSGDVTLTASTASGNSTRGDKAHGGGIFTGWSTITPIGNLFRSDAGTLNLINSTISGNSVGVSFIPTVSNGGGLYAAGSVINIADSTIVENSATGTGGGIGLNPDFAEVILPDDTIVDRTVTLHNSIIAGNSDGETAPDFIAPNDPTANLDVQYSLIGDALGTSLNVNGGTPDASGNLIGAHLSPLDPMLGALSNNGGPTQTRRLLPGSPAINAGDNALIPVGINSDQRGLPFVRDDGLGVDMGAYERQTLTDPALLVVTTASDEQDFANSDISLREAIGFANGSIGADTITFDPAVFDGESSDLIRLTMGNLQITEQLTIDGLSSGAAGVAISGDSNGDDILVAGTQITDVVASLDGDDRLDDNSRIFNIDDVAPTNESFDVTLIGLTLTGGRTTRSNSMHSDTTHSGGAISSLSSGTLSLTSSTVSGNSIRGRFADGGGIYALSADVTLTSSTVSGNSTSGDDSAGGGIYAKSGDVTLTSSTVSGNNTSGEDSDGGGIATNSGDVTLTDSSVTGNSTSGELASGGGIKTFSGNVTLTSSTVSENGTSGERSGGGGILTSSGDVTLTSSTVSANSTNGEERGGGGGGIAAGSGDVTLSSSIVTGNSTSAIDGDGGGIATNSGDVTLTESAVSGNSTSGREAAGGGIFTNRGDVTLNSSTVNGNGTSGDLAAGGGIAAGGSPFALPGDVTLINSTVGGNYTSGDEAAGGGIFALSGDVTLTASTVSGNSTNGVDSHGGGIFTGWSNITPIGNLFRSDAGTVNLTNSTISGNAVNGATSSGGGLFVAGSLINLANSTIVDNSATVTGGGIGLIPQFAEVILPDDSIVDRTVTLHNSIIAGNSDGGTAPDFIAPNDSTANLDVQYSLIGDTDGNNTPAGNGNLLEVDPLLGPLADNGGPTLTHALLPSSPAIDAGDPTILFDTNEFDQRGTPLFRVFGSIVDIGAFERQPRAVVGGPYAGDEGSPIALSGSASTLASIYDWDLDNDGQYDDATGQNVNFPTTDDGVFTIGLRINGVGGPTDSTTVTVNNVAPMASVVGPLSGVPFQPRTFTLTATDVSPVDQAVDFSFDIDWNGDSVIDETVVGPSGTQIEHAFTAVNNNTVRVTATDKDSGTSTESTHPINIVRMVLQGGDLVWGGTTGADAVEFEETAAQTVEVRMTLLNGVVVSDTQTFVGVSGRVIVYGGDKADTIDAGGVDGLTNIGATLIGGLGHDTIYGGDAADTIRGDAEGDGSEGKDVIDGGGGDDLIYGDGMEGAADTIMGGDGNDTIYGDNGDISGDGAEGNDVIYGNDGDDLLYGGRRNDSIFGGDGNDTIDGQTGNDILSGGTGNDTLRGGDGKDLLFAGAGADMLYGGAGGDILVAGTTSFDFSEADLKLIGNEWRSSGNYATRIANISGTPGGANDPTFLQPGSTVLDDADIDTLFGEGDNDWFLDSQTGLIPDILSDLQTGEVETDIA